MIQGNPIPYELTLFLTQMMVALAIVALAIAAKASRKQPEQRLRVLEVHALRATVEKRRSPSETRRGIDR